MSNESNIKQDLIRSVISSNNVAAIPNIIKAYPDILNINIGDSVGNNIINWLIIRKEYKILSLIAKNIEKKHLEYKNYNGDSSILFAIKNNDEKLVEFILNKGVDINILNTKNEGVINEVIINNNTKLLNLLVGKNINKKITGISKDLLQSICENGLFDFLIKNNIDFYGEDSNKKNIIFYMLNTNFSNNAFTNIVQKININTKNNENENVLMLCLKYSKLDYAQIIMNNRKDIDYETVNNQTGDNLLNYSILYRADILIQKIAENTKTINRRNFDGDDAYLIAKKHNNTYALNIIKSITEKKVLTNTLDKTKIEVQEKIKIHKI